MATRKTSSTASSSLKKTATTNVSRKMQTAPHQLMTSEERKQIGKELLLLISSDTSVASKEHMTEEERLDPNNSPFLIGASQVTTDLALAAQCEFEEDIHVEDDRYFDYLRSPMYWKSREAFIEDAVLGNPRALLNFAWRHYNAGLLSPDRLLPDSKQTRQERRARSLERQLPH